MNNLEIVNYAARHAGDPITKRIALEMLRDGSLTQSEAARLAGVSRQLMRLWAKGIDWHKARRGWLLTQWNQRARDGMGGG